MLAAQESLSAIHGELCADVSEITYAEIYFLLVKAIHCYDEAIKIGIPFVPEFQTIALVGLRLPRKGIIMYEDINVLFDGVLHEDNPHVIAHRSKYS